MNFLKKVLRGPTARAALRNPRVRKTLTVNVTNKLLKRNAKDHLILIHNVQHCH